MSLVPLGFHMPLQGSIWYYSYFIVQYEYLFKLLNFIYHTLPACLMDFLHLLIGKKMVYRKAYRKTEKVLLRMAYFGTREWNFGNENVRRLIEESKKFEFSNENMDFDLKNINWEEYFRNYIPGIKRHFFKENCKDAKKLVVTYQW